MRGCIQTFCWLWSFSVLAVAYRLFVGCGVLVYERLHTDFLLAVEF